MSESTPLLTTSGASSNAYYFLQRPNEVSRLAGREGDSVLNVLPDGSTLEEFSSRPVNAGLLSSQRGTSTTTSTQGANKPGLFSFLFGTAQQKNTLLFETSTKAAVGSMVKPRQAPVKVEPKVFFSNERTFLAWLHTSVLLAGASIAITSFAKANPYSQIYGLILLPVSIAFISYSMYQYSKRASMIRRRAPGPYEDLVGPTVLGIALILSILLQFSLKLYTML